MHEFLFFTIGLLLGGIVGVMIMSLLQINRIRHFSDDRKEDDKV